MPLVPDFDQIRYISHVYSRLININVWLYNKCHRLVVGGRGGIAWPISLEGWQSRTSHADR
jgi:hypothetical protein